MQSLFYSLVWDSETLHREQSERFSKGIGVLFFCDLVGVQKCCRSYKGFPKGVQPLFPTSPVFRNVSGKENATLQLVRKVSFIVVSAVLQSVTRRE